MKKTLSISDSLVGSICREIEFIRQRSKTINSSISYCNDKFLKKRLQEELEAHKTRKDELISISSLVISNKEGNKLSNLFLQELFRRS